MRKRTTHRRNPGHTGPLALHIRHRRKLYGDHGLSQRELATLAGVSRRALVVSEARRRFTESVRLLLAVAIALKVRVEGLIDPRHGEDVRRAVEARRADVEAEAKRRGLKARRGHGR